MKADQMRFVLIDREHRSDFPVPQWNEYEKSLTWTFRQEDVGRVLSGTRAEFSSGERLNVPIKGGGFEEHPFNIRVVGDSATMVVAGLYIEGSTIDMCEVARRTAGIVARRAEAVGPMALNT